ncbi:hypothetical protein ACPB9E_08195 [Streptomyces exfoliatus]|uniref:hypothetical protein n=1 Tax=Streptomyces exfoliatus TaxID=1905 RepID=UPI003C2F2924
MDALHARARRRRLLRLRHHRPRRVEHLGGGHRVGRLHAPADPAVTVAPTAVATASHDARATTDARAASPAVPRAAPASRTDHDAAASPGHHPGTGPRTGVPRTSRHGTAGAQPGGGPAAPARAGTHPAAATAGRGARRAAPLPAHVTASADGPDVRRHHDAGDHRARGPRDRDPPPPLPLTSD